MMAGQVGGQQSYLNVLCFTVNKIVDSLSFIFGLFLATNIIFDAIVIIIVVA